MRCVDMKLWLAATTVCIAGCTGTIDVDGVSDATAPIDAAPAGWDPATRSVAKVRNNAEGPVQLLAAPDADADVIATVPKGAFIDVFSAERDGFREARFLADTAGWIWTEHLRFDTGATSSGANLLLPWKPDKAFRVSQGHNSSYSHSGTSAWAWDFAMAEGTVLLAAHGGKVVDLKKGSTRGGCNSAYRSDANFVVIDRGDGKSSSYWHLSEVDVNKGQLVTRGQRIGKSGQTGYSCGAHLHFQLEKTGQRQSVKAAFWDTGKPVDPGVGDRPVSANRTLDIP